MHQKDHVHRLWPITPKTRRNISHAKTTDVSITAKQNKQTKLTFALFWVSPEKTMFPILR